MKPVHTTGKLTWDHQGTTIAYGATAEMISNAGGITITAPLMDHVFLKNIKKVIFNCPATIIVWEDGTKTVVKLMDGDTWDPEKGFALAYLKGILGNERFKKEFKKHVKPQVELENNTENLIDALLKFVGAKKEDK